MRLALLTAGDPDRVTGGYLFHRRMADRATQHGAELTFVSVPDRSLPWALAAGPRWVRDPAIAEAELVVLDSIAAAPAAPWLGALRVPVVGMLHQPPGGMEGARLARAVRARFDRWAYRRAGLLMVASDWLASQLVAGGVQPAMLRVVPPGKDPATGNDALGAAAPPGERTRLRQGRRIAALCVANWLPRKGIVELLEAVARLPDELLTLHLVGDQTAGGRYARRVRERLTAPDLRDRAVVHGILPATEVQRLYGSVDAFVLPSFEEPYGTVWGEAMAAGLPVIGWRAGNLPFLAGHEEEGLLVSRGDVGALGRALERIARDEELRARLGSAAALRAEGRPTWDETAAMFFRFIREVLARHGARAPAAR